MPNSTTIADGREADGMAPACISAILETESTMYDLRQLFDGYQLHIFPLYTEFTHKQATDPVKTADQLKYDNSLDVPVVIRNKRTQKKMGMTRQRIDEPEEYEKRIYPEPEKKASTLVPKRGIIRGMSKKSSIGLRKRAARIDDLALWIDLTFSDDVLENMSITERAQFSYYCLKRLMKYAKDKFGLHLIWKREYKLRKSGRNKGEAMPHFHVLIGGLTPKQQSIWINICVQLLVRWVQITGTDNDDALAVAINKKSYRRIENPKHATCYISKYFSKDEPIDIPEGESIGRCWGYSKSCPDVKPHIIKLSQRQSINMVRILIRKKNLNTKKGRFLKHQLQNGHPTFLFEDDMDMADILEFIGYYDPIPF